jgi:hypothetical protein
MTITKQEIAARCGVTLEWEADPDTHKGHVAKIDAADAKRVREAFEAAGYQASDAPDNDDRNISWLYVVR